MFKTKQKFSHTNLLGRLDNLQPSISNSLSDVSDDTTFGNLLRGFNTMSSFSSWDS